MIREFLKNYPFVELALIGQFLFFTIFMAALIWVFRPASKSFYEKLAALPLDSKESRDE